MEIRFSLHITLETAKGRKNFGILDFGIAYEPATELFSMLKGNTKPGGSRYILLEFMEEIAALPVPIGNKHCNLGELKENTAIITKEIFRINELEL